MSFISHFKRLDWVLVLVPVILVSIGLASIYSSSLGEENFSDFKKQIIFFVIGIVLMVALSFVDWRLFRENSRLILILYGLCLIGLVGLFFFAPEIRGVKGWYKVGPFTIDVIEFTKIVLIILLAKYFSTRHIELHRIRHILFSAIYVFLPAILIFFQPDLGSVFILIALWIGVLLVSGMKFRHFLILILCGLLILALGWNFILKDYQKVRIASFLNPSDLLGTSWNQNQAKIAIGSGGILGQGFGNGSQTRYGFLPEAKTDFVFASIAEEGGLITIFALLFLFFILFKRIFKIAITSRANFTRLFTTGFAVILVSQIFIHIGMNLGLLPIIGISLPLVSYGGSNLLATFIGLGILQNIKNNP